MRSIRAALAMFLALPLLCPYAVAASDDDEFCGEVKGWVALMQEAKICELAGVPFKSSPDVLKGYQAFMAANVKRNISEAGRIGAAQGMDLAERMATPVPNWLAKCDMLDESAVERLDEGPFDECD
jgi:hypothetical protein